MLGFVACFKGAVLSCTKRYHAAQRRLCAGCVQVLQQCTEGTTLPPWQGLKKLSLQ
jgi:hypothetical protein